VIDSHCHLDFSEFAADRAEVLLRAKEVGVTTFINPGCTLERSGRAVELAAELPEIYAAVGVHPHDCSEINSESILELEKLATNPKVVAIGEIGLDYFRLGENVERRTQNVEFQKLAFRKQLELARKLSKPVILHTRDAESDTLAILREFADVRGVAHCYTGSLQFAQQLIELGWLIGFTGIITFKNAAALREVVQAIPLEKILLETDSPYLAPEPYRGQRAEPAHVVEVAKKIAEIKSVNLEEVIRVTSNNTKNLFQIKSV
jgi:TatD DNase family protein